VTDQQPQVSVVIPTFNRRDSLRRVIDSVLQDPAAAEVVVVVDGSSDGSIELLEQVSRSEPRVKPFAVEHRGLNAAIQAGVERATRELVLILDDDLEATDGLVSGHARHHEGAESLVVLGYSPVAIPAGGGTRAVTAALYSEAYERSCRSFEELPDDILLHLYGGHMSIRRAACLRVGVYSEPFQERYHPDREFGIRCLKAGLVGRFDRSLLARHHYNRSLSEFRNDARSQGAATVLLHRLHPDVLGPVDPCLSTVGAPRSARWLIRLSRLPRFHDVISSAVASSVRLLGRSHASSLQLDAVKLLARMEHQHGLHTELGREAREQISPGETRAAAPGD
jgi:glycosyltransferase involved in cell wall biosynthesis